MKQIVQFAPENTVALSSFNANLDKYYGIDFGGGLKGFVVRNNYAEGSFSVLAVESLSCGNRHMGYCEDSIEKLAATAIKWDHAFFEFESFQELTDWINN